MAMTGNHNAMSTADTVYMKHRATKTNVRVIADAALPTVVSMPGKNFFMTSDQKSYAELYENDAHLKKQIKTRLNLWQNLWWKPVILTGTKAIGWHKTLGKAFPKK